MKNRLALYGIIVVALMLSDAAQASLFHGETLDAIADGAAWVVLFIAPLAGIGIFLLIHILPEKIAEDRKHPQAKAIQVLCLLSLFFGGMLWPIAWLWAYSKPVLHKMAYGTDKDPDYYKEHGLPEPADAALDLRQRVTALEGRGVPAGEIEAIRADLASLEARIAGSDDKAEVI